MAEVRITQKVTRFDLGFEGQIFRSQVFEWASGMLNSAHLVEVFRFCFFRSKTGCVGFDFGFDCAFAFSFGLK